jgi:branched-chain amino acid aminotransferase
VCYAGDTMLYYVNGAHVEEEEAKLSVLDLGLVRGYGVFDYLRTYQKRPFHLLEHLHRLRYSATQIGLTLPCPIEEMQSIIENLVEKAPYAECSIKILVTGGISPDQFLPQEKPSLVILVYPCKSFPETFFTDGIPVTTTTLYRCIPMSKTIQYIPAILALKQGKHKNAQEALYLNAKREILEATTSNFFAFKKDTLITCDSDEMLLGITRSVVLKLAEAHFPIEFRALPYEEIPELDEAFISSSNREVMPVTHIDDCVIGNGNPGPNTQKLLQLFRDYTQENAWLPLKISRYN